MVLSFGLLLIVGLTLGWVFQKMHLPVFIGYMLCGMLLGPYGLNVLHELVNQTSASIRQIALILILLRSGLQLDVKDIGKQGISALMLSFVPASFEIVGYTVFAHILFGFSWLEGALLGCVISAVSPAVVVPSMLRVMEEGYGTKKGIPQMILAGSNLDDIYVIVLFSLFLSLLTSGQMNMWMLLRIPTSIGSGLLVGYVCGKLISHYLKVTDTMILVMILLGMSLVFVGLETFFTGIIGFSGLLAVMVMGLTIHMKQPKMAAQVQIPLKHAWSIGQLFLFALVGASVNLGVLVHSGWQVIVLIFLCLLVRMVGVLQSVWFSKTTWQERVFVMIAYTPKATVQAAIGGIALANGLASGMMILVVAVCSILITAPLGAIGIEQTYHRLLTWDK